MALISIDQDDFERVIKFGFAKKPGDEITKYLIFELMGNIVIFFIWIINIK